MLTALSIRDIVLIEKLDITLDKGLTVLTGETGAGKSILLDSLGLALGARGDSSLVRAGAERGVVTAAFALPSSHAAFAVLREQGIETLIHFPVPIPRQPALAGLPASSCPVADQVCDEVFSLPLHPALADSDVDRVVASVHDFRAKAVGR